MIDDLEDYRAPIPNVRMIRQITVPRWAVEDPEPGDQYVAPEMPDLGDANNVFFRSKLNLEPEQLYLGRLLSARHVSGEDRMIELSHVESYYNEVGLLIERREFNEGTLQQRQRFLFDAEGRLTRKVLEDHHDEQLERTELQYGDDRKLLSETVTYSDGSKQVTAHRWAGPTDDAITSNDEGVVGQVRTTYDEKGRVVERSDIDPSTGTKSGVFWEFDAADKLISVGTIDKDGTRWISETFEYDESGHETAWAEFDRQGTTLQQRLSSYEGDDCTEFRLIDSNGETVTSQIFNEEHKILQSLSSGPDGNSEAIYLYEETGLLNVTATRTETKLVGGPGYGYYGGGTPRAYVEASTTWWQYEFSPS